MSRTAAQWDEAYAERAASGQTLWTAGPNDTVASVLGDLACGTALDVAAGEGRHALWLAERGWQVTAVDFSGVGLDLAARTAAARGLHLDTVRADVTDWAPDGAFDLVLCAYLHLPSALSHPLLERMGHWVAPGGRLVTLGHDRANLDQGVGGPQDPDVLWDAGLLGTVAAAAGLDVARLEPVHRPVEGADRPALDVLLVAVRSG